MSKSGGRVDLATFREVHRKQQEEAKKGPEAYIRQQRAVIRLVENQLKEARVGDYTLVCDEAKSRKGGGKGPSPLQYFVAAAGF